MSEEPLPRGVSANALRDDLDRFSDALDRLHEDAVAVDGVPRLTLVRTEEHDTGPCATPNDDDAFETDETNALLDPDDESELWLDAARPGDEQVEMLAADRGMH